MDRFIRKIRRQRHPLKQWNLRTSHDKKKVLKKLIEILVFVSGDDLRNLLNSVLEEIDHNQNIRTREHSALIGIISNLNLRIKPKCKHFYLKELRIAGFSKSEVKKLGFKFSDWLWEKCLDSTNRNLGGRPSIGN